MDSLAACDSAIYLCLHIILLIEIEARPDAWPFLTWSTAIDLNAKFSVQSRPFPPLDQSASQNKVQMASTIHLDVVRGIFNALFGGTKLTFKR